MSDTTYLSTEQVADLLGLSPRTLEDWRYQGSGPAHRKFGRSVRYLRLQVIEWAEAQARAHTSQGEASGNEE